MGEALVRASKGNAALALLLLVGTNALGIATMPPWLKVLLSDVDGLSVSVDALQLFVKLLCTVLAPACVGKACRELFPPVRRFVTKYKLQLSMFNTLQVSEGVRGGGALRIGRAGMRACGLATMLPGLREQPPAALLPTSDYHLPPQLACIIWQTLSSAQSVLVSQSFLDIFIVICAGKKPSSLSLVFSCFSALRRVSGPVALRCGLQTGPRDGLGTDELPPRRSRLCLC